MDENEREKDSRRGDGSHASDVLGVKRDVEDCARQKESSDQSYRRGDVTGLTVAVEDRSDEPSLNKEQCDVAIAEATGEAKGQQDVKCLTGSYPNAHATREKWERSKAALDDDEGDSGDEADDEESDYDGRIPLEGGSTSRERHLW